MPKIPTDDRPVRRSKAGRKGRNGRLGRFSGKVSVLTDLVEFLQDYMAMPERSVLVIAAWVVAAWLTEYWDRFPHLAVTSPQKRCGKTTLLKLLKWVTPNACLTPNGSAAAIYRLIEKQNPKPTFLLDESQSLKRLGSESAEVTRELFNAGIDRDAVSLRCVGKDSDVKAFSLYSPKVLALIGDLDNVLADRCLPIRLDRKRAEDQTRRYRDRLVQPVGEKLVGDLKKWVDRHGDRAAEVYDDLDEFEIANDRLAELLLPLQTVLTVMNADKLLDELRQYAEEVDQSHNDDELPDDILLLSACRDVFNGQAFLTTEQLLRKLCEREEEPWAEYNRGEPITPHKIGKLLGRYGIKSGFTKHRDKRGYDRRSFEDAWSRYVPVETSEASQASEASPSRRAKR